MTTEEGRAGGVLGRRVAVATGAGRGTHPDIDVHIDIHIDVRTDASTPKGGPR